MMFQLNSNCFLCFNSCISSSNCNWKDIRKPLITVAKYINLSSEISNEDQYQIPQAIMICDECQIILKIFSDLYKALEIAKMKVDSCLKEIHNLVIAHDSQASTSNNFETTEIDTFRGNLIKRISSKLQTSKSQPVVKLERTRVSRIRSHATSVSEVSTLPWTPEANLNEEFKIEADDNDTDMDTNTEDNVDESLNSNDNEEDPLGGEQEKYDDVDEDVEKKFFIIKNNHNRIGMRKNPLYCLRCNMNVRDRSYHLKTYHKKVSPSQPPRKLSCPYCRAEFLESRIAGVRKRRFYRSSGSLQLRQHMLQYHGHHFFSNEKLDSVSDTDFQKIVTELLFKDLIEGRESCAFCPRAITIPGKKTKKAVHSLRVKLHYVELHENKLQEKLKMIQEDPDLQEKLRNCNPNGKVCLSCGIYVINYGALDAHRRFHCNMSTRKKEEAVANQISDGGLPDTGKDHQSSSWTKKNSKHQFKHSRGKSINIKPKKINKNSDPSSLSVCDPNNEVMMAAKMETF